jgi:hypothetical protein
MILTCIINVLAWSADGSHLFPTAWSEGSRALLSIDLRGDLLLTEASGDGWLCCHKLRKLPVPRQLEHFRQLLMRTVLSV